MIVRVLGLLVLGVLIAGPSRAQTSTETVIGVVFDEVERRLVQEYYEALRRAGASDLDEDEDGSSGRSGKNKEKKDNGVRGRGEGRKEGWVQGIPPGHLPAPGECRAWLPDTPPGQQPPPGPCRQIARDLPPGARLVYGGARGKNDTLPDELGVVLPDDLVDELPLPYPDTVRVLVDDDVYLIRQSTRLILDVIENVLKSE